MPKPITRQLQTPAGLTIHVPSGYADERELQAEEPTMVCNVIVDYDGNLCGQTFVDGEERQWQKHCGTCAQANIEHIKAASMRERMPMFDPASWDPEMDAYMLDVGRRMREEGRWTVKKSERAGF